MKRILSMGLFLAFLVGGASEAQESHEVRRVVTGLSKEGKSVFVESLGPPEVIRFESLPGLELTRLWATTDVPVVTDAGEVPSPAPGSYFPARGETRFSLVRLPSASELAAAQEAGSSPEDFLEELEVKVPDLAASMRGESASLHATDTVDYIVVLSGEIVLELDDGAMTQLSPGDVVIQNGTVHAWHNVGEDAAVLAAVLVGAQRPE